MPAGLDEQALSTLSAAELHALCRRLGVETLIVTLGSRGAFASSPSGYLSVPATPGIIPVDTTGAGDAFVGSLACALAEYGLAALERAVRFANTAAGVSVGRIGAAASMPLRAEIDRCCVRP
jgi:ribokinase